MNAVEQQFFNSDYIRESLYAQRNLNNFIAESMGDILRTVLKSNRTKEEMMGVFKSSSLMNVMWNVFIDGRQTVSWNADRLKIGDVLFHEIFTTNKIDCVNDNGFHWGYQFYTIYLSKEEGVAVDEDMVLAFID